MSSVVRRIVLHLPRRRRIFRRGGASSWPSPSAPAEENPREATDGTMEKARFKLCGQINGLRHPAAIEFTAIDRDTRRPKAQATNDEGGIKAAGAERYPLEDTGRFVAQLIATEGTNTCYKIHIRQPNGSTVMGVIQQQRQKHWKTVSGFHRDEPSGWEIDMPARDTYLHEKLCVPRHRLEREREPVSRWRRFRAWMRNNLSTIERFVNMLTKLTSLAKKIWPALIALIGWLVSRWN